MSYNIIARTEPKVNVEFVSLEDGVYYNPAINEWEIIIDGDVVAWAATQAVAWMSYNDMLRIDREHTRRNPANRTFILNGEPVTWASCPECGMVLDEGESCPRCDIPFMGEPVYAGQGWGGAPERYGLEARG